MAFRTFPAGRPAPGTRRTIQVCFNVLRLQGSLPSAQLDNASATGYCFLIPVEQRFCCLAGLQIRRR